ncbi:MAG: HAMP domain-containing protein, partial [Solirubrobacteraceae bacterium]|nr:HAMP domain-containing protein [Solirubrobacteraceae bacterium]
MTVLPRDPVQENAAGAPGHSENPGGALSDALNWQPRSRLGKIAMIGIGRVPGPRLLRAHQISTGIALVISNLVGAAILIVLNLAVIPGSPLPEGDTRTVGIVIIASYLGIAFVVGGVLIFRQSDRAWLWLRENRPPTEREELAVLRGPLRVLWALMIFWTVGTLIAFTVTLFADWRLALRVGITTLIGGLSTSAFGYLLTERVMRTAARVVLPHRDDAAPPALPGAQTRQMLSWALGTGSAVFGVWIVGLLVLSGAIVPDSGIGWESFAKRLAVVMLVLGSISLTVGLIAEVFTARAVSDPIKQLRLAIQRVTEGDLTARVAIDDASEVGLLQAGFNRMAA